MNEKAKATMNEKAKATRNAYYRAWRERNRDKVRKYNTEYWERRAKQAEECSHGEDNKETGA